MHLIELNCLQKLDCIKLYEFVYKKMPMHDDIFESSARSEKREAKDTYATYVKELQHQLEPAPETGERSAD